MATQNPDKLKAELAQLKKELKQVKKENEAFKKRELTDGQFCHYWKSFFKHYPDTVMVLDTKGTILDINKVVKGLKKKEVIGSSVFDYVSDESIKEYKKIFRAVLKTGKTHEIELKGHGPNGKEAWWKSQLSPVYDEKSVKKVMVATTDITDKRLDREKLIKQQERYQVLIEHVPDGVIIHDERANLLFANPAALRMMKVKSLVDLKKKQKIFDHILPEYHEEIKEKLKYIQKGKRVPTARYKYRRNDNKIVEFETTAVGITYEGESAVLVVYRELELERELAMEKERVKVAEQAKKELEKEVKERKRIEEALRKSEEKFREIFENNSDHIFQVSKDKKIEFINYVAPGLNKEDVIGTPLLDFVPANEKEKLKEVLVNVFEKGQAEQYDSKYTMHGNEIYYSTTVSPLKLGKEVFAATFISRNITERVKAEEALRESEERYKALYNKANIPILQVDLNGNFIQVNDGASELFGYTKKELLKKNVSDVTYHEDLQISEEKLEMMRQRNSETLNMEKRYVHKDGSIIFAKINANVVKDQEGKPQHHITVIQDITKEKEDEEKIKKALEEKEVLLKEIHHRVKNNLQVISSIFNLQSSYVKDDKALALLKENQDRIKSMAYIHESLYQTKDFSDINFSEYVSQLTNNLIHSYNLENAEIELRESIDEVKLNLDQAIPCGLIVNELVSNSLKYAFRDQREGLVEVGLKKTGEKIKISIKDDGVGFPEDIDFKNTASLGLQLVVSLTEQLGGKIDMKNKKGTNFTLTFKAI